MVTTLHSKWKNIFGEVDKSGSFEGVNPKTTTSADGSIIDLSTEFIAVNWLTSGGGAVGIFETRNYSRVKTGFPLIYAHSATVTDIKFSNLNPSLLATSSDDGKVKLWTIPDGGIKDDLKLETQCFTGHSRKSCLLSWNPSCMEVIASMGNDSDLFVWNITNSEEIIRIKTEDSMAYNLEWNLQGNLLGGLFKNKKLNIFDVRNKDGAVLTTEGHDTAKIQKLGFADGPFVFSSGFNSKGYREIKLYDTRNFTAPIQSQKLDTLQGMLSHYYDEDLGIVYLHGKGEGSITYIEVKEGAIKLGNTFSSGDQASAVAFFPKRAMDYNTCELARAAKLSKDSINYVSFKYPRRAQGYQEEFYPHCFTGEQTLTLDEWKSGETKELPRKAIIDIENKFKSEPILFQKKVQEVRKTVTIEAITEENILLKERVAELEKEVALLRSKQQ